MDFPRGSTWRKWDLHIHSKFSHEPNAKLEVKGIFDNAITNNIKVISITDHTNVDSLDDIWDIWENDTNIDGNKYKDLIYFFPGIELKASAGRKGVHFLAIFPRYITKAHTKKKVDSEYIQQNFLSKIDCSKSDIEEAGEGDYKKGLFKKPVDLKKASSVIRDIGGLIIVHSGDKHHSIEREIKHPSGNADVQELLNTLGTEKESLMREYIDICELPNWNTNSQKEAIFYYETFHKPSVVFSDSHETYLSSNTWIKADPTIEGLKQLLVESKPGDRIFIGSTPPAIDFLNQNKTKIIDIIEIAKEKSLSLLMEKWFNCSIPLNHGLVAIIGNKGSGKSALSDTIGLLGNTRNYRSFSFLNFDKFRSHKNNKAKYFKAKLIWQSGDPYEQSLDHDIDENDVETIHYIPQDFLEKTCDTTLNDLDYSFQNELEHAIFSHVKLSDRAGKSSFAELINYKTLGTLNSIESLKSDLAKINSEIIKMEIDLLPENKKKLENHFKEKEKELKSHESSKPIEIKEPTASSDNSKTVRIMSNLSKCKKILKSYEDQQAYLENIIAQISLTETNLKNAIVFINTFKGQYEVLISNLSKLIESTDLNIKDIISLELNTDLIKLKLNELSVKKKSFVDHGKLISTKISRTEKMIETRKMKLDEPQKEYQTYLSNLKKWDEVKKDIHGTIYTADTYEYYKNELKLLKGIPNKLYSKRSDRLKKSIEIYSALKEIVEQYKSIYKPVIDFIDNHELISSDINLHISVGIKESGFSDKFFEIISQHPVSNFQGIDKGSENLNRFLKSCDFDSSEGVKDFLNNLVSMLEEQDNDKKGINRLIKKGKSLIDLYDFIFSLDYLKPEHRLTKGEKELSQLSPGERGELLLLFYLLIDNSTCPLVLDQPEENLDNQSIFKTLVKCIREAKTKRQVIIVTHNPNLAVVSDAEQVIYSEHDKYGDKSVRYVTGSIENPIINKHIVDVLEGTRPAFDIRDQKYQE
ncbi:MAG: hypothetical protein KAW88_04080 [Candidatus Cloacimonetes bacterium]|nr:hypothetical protein [Candidatus Cloacimonadota bacterium]